MDDKRIDLNLMLALEALLAEQNVTRAARRLRLSQPALSAQLSRLRDLFGDELLRPTSRGVVPTAMAREMDGPLRLALDQVRDVVARSRTFDPLTSTATLTIAASDYMQVGVLLPFMTELPRIAPGVRLMVSLVHDSRAVAASLERGDIDVAFLQRTDVIDGGLHRTDMFEEHYVGVARKGSVDGAGMTMERFTSARHILVSPRAEGFSGATDAALSAVGASRHVAFAVSSFLVMLETIAQSDLIGMVPARLAKRFEDRVDTFIAPVDVEGFCMSMVWHDRTHTHPARRWLRERLMDFCGEG